MTYKVLVTGGAGFLGSHVADELSQKGCNVTILDVKKSIYLKNNQTMVIGDLLDEDLVSNIVKDMDYVFHFAGISDIKECAKSPVKTVKNNILTTLYLLDVCKNHPLKRFIFASSAYVYSKSGLFYRSSKRACEDLIRDYNEAYNLPYTILRFGSLYGTRADERNSIHRILKQALIDKKIVYHGTGEEIREFIHVKDVAKICYQVLNPAFENNHYIITGNEKFKYKDLLQMVMEIAPDTVELVMKESTGTLHYKATPYNFSPILAEKIVANPHVDMGQGLLDCINQIYQEWQDTNEQMD